MDHLLMVLVLLWSSGLQAEDKHQPTGSQCESTAKADIGLMVSESGRISPEDHENMKSFLTKIVSYFDIGPDKVQIGLVQNSENPKIEWQLNTHQTKQSLLEAINHLPQRRRDDSGDDLGGTLDRLFKPTAGMRADSQRIAVLITDAESSFIRDPGVYDLKNIGIEIYIIAVNKGHLIITASDPEETHMFRVSDSSFLLDIVDNITINLCNSAVDSVRLVNGTKRCSGRLEVKSEQSWSSVCEADFDQQDAEVVCKELSCGAPSVLQGALYGEVEAPMWTKEFQCGGHESALLDCGRSDSARSTCSPGKAVGLTCSEPVRLVGGASHCAGTLEVKLGEWRPVYDFYWSPKKAAVACTELDCGSAVSTGNRNESSVRSVWRINRDCVESGSSLRDCVISSSGSSSSIMELTCSDSVRLVNGTSLCSGRLEVKSEQSWSSVCEADFDQQDAEVVCRELGCGAPSVLQGALYGEVEAPMRTKEFQCGGRESALLDCGRSDSARSTCSPGKAVGLTCSEPVRLVGGASRCEGTLEVKLGEWRPVHDFYWSPKIAAVACTELDCGSAVSSGNRKEPSERSVWRINRDCVESGSSLRDCVTSRSYSSIMKLICSDLLLKPITSVSSTMDGVSKAQQQGFLVRRGSNFTISCSVQPQYPGGSFQLTFTSSNTTHNYTQPAVNHSADFLFPAADPTHQGNYSCVYGVYVFAHNFSSESRLLSLTVTDPTVHIIRLVVLPVTLLLVVTVVFFILKASRGQKSGPQENIELDSYNLGVSRAEGEPAEEEGAQGAE
ncbi:scavenger receptor cysteine-rich type 1 protein M130-like isoform X1 [Thunnus thynnus]|uniref:scavenger receptor cysteine-rich type 1 protein M130-like isoform X1 n=1 Tax=Thunnus thynnus TaxID=8237 RepID=UPI003526EAD9